MSKRKPMEELTIKVPWGHVAALAWGDSRNRPVLVVHGTMDNAHSFTRLIQLLPEHYYFVAIDLPGHGLSSHLPAGLMVDFSYFFSVFYFVLEGLGWEKCHYIGHSFGGAMGVLTDAVIPGRLERIVTFDIISGYMFRPDQLIARMKDVSNTTFRAAKCTKPTLYTKEEIMNALQHRRPSKLKREAAEVMFERGTTRVGDKYKLNRDERMKTYVMPYWNFEQYAPFFRQGPAPVLLISAKDSWYKMVKQPEIIDRIRQNFSDKITVVSVDGNHDVHNNSPEIVAPLIIKFFNGENSKL